jgi:hypothetical protein
MEVKMGDRALVIVHNKGKTEYSPVLYLHWHAPQVQNYVNRLKEVMQGRTDDVSYAFARLVGIAHNDVDGNLSLGVWDKGSDFKDDEKYLKELSHGDGGVYLVDASDFSIRAGFGGYGLEDQNDKRDGGKADRDAAKHVKVEVA